MNTMRRLVLGSLLVLFIAVPCGAQPARKDVIWARVASGPITLDGIPNEPSWAQAESMTVRYGQENGIPGSGCPKRSAARASGSPRPIFRASSAP